MKHFFVAAVIAAIVADLHAGLVYRFENVTEAAGSHTFAGTVKADEGKVRIDVTSGDTSEPIFRKGSIVLSSKGSSVVTVVDPAKKTYYELDLSRLLSGAAGAMSNDFANVEIGKPNVAVRKNGNGGIVEGYPTTRSTIDTSFDMTVVVLKKKMAPFHLAMTTQVWSTDRLPAGAANIIETTRLHTGIESLDRMIDAQTSGVVGFPLKQITTTKTTINGSTTTGVSTSKVSGIRQANVAASEFTVPAGYRKVENPLEALTLGLRP